jgi:energy-coupling factor transporter ATP-binding protein EcfA2
VSINNDTYFNPFPGLRPFEEDEEYLFFGREKQIDELLDRLRTNHFLAVIGASGSGKSSLVKSGLLPSLYSGYMAEAGSRWRVTLFRPGSNPIREMAQALAQPGVLYDDSDVIDMMGGIIETTLRRSSLGLTEAVKQSDISERDNLLLVVDQFEELFRFSKYEKNVKTGKRDAPAFINLLLEASRQKEIPIYIVFTMRSDFLGDCTEFRGFPEAINKGQYLIPRMKRDERKDAIAGPIAVGGAKISKRLLTRLLNDVGDNPDQLPILQHALMRTWDHWKTNSNEDEEIDLYNYEESGTMLHALSQHAEEAFSEIRTNEGKVLCQKLFKAITDKGSDSRGIRRPTALGEICALAECELKEMAEIIEIFRKPGRSFLMPAHETELTADSIIDISHESLMRIWTRLIKWVDDEGQSAETYVRLSESAALYQEGKAGVWRDPELQVALRWKELNKPNQLWANRYDPSFERAMAFLAYSKEQHDFALAQVEKQRKRRLLFVRVFVGILAVAFVVAIGFAIKAWRAQGIAEEAKNEALKEKNLAEKQKTEIDGLYHQTESLLSQSDSLLTESDSLKVEALAKQKISDSLRLAAQASEARATSALARLDGALTVLTQQKDEIDKKYEQLVAAQNAADSAKVAAAIAEQETKNLKLSSTSKTLAIKAMRLYDDGQYESAVTLAMHAYYFHNDTLPNEALYPALAKVLHKPNSSRSDLVRIHNRHEVRSVDVDALGKFFVTGGEDGHIRIWAYSSNRALEEVYSYDTREAVRTVRITPDGKFIFASLVNGAVYRYENRFNSLENRKLVELRFGSIAHSIEFASTSSGQKVVIGYPNTQLIFDALTLDEVLIFNEKNVVTLATFNQGDTCRIAIYKPDSNVVIWRYNGASTSLSNPQEIPFSGKITAMTYSPDGKFMAFGTSGGTIQLWNNREQKLVQTFSGHKSSITQLCFNHQSTQLASSSFDFSARLWPVSQAAVEQGTLILQEGNQWIRSLTYLPGDDALVVVGNNGLVQIWPTTKHVIAERICNFIQPIEASVIKQHIDDFTYDYIQKPEYKQTAPCLYK